MSADEGIAGLRQYRAAGWACVCADDICRWFVCLMALLISLTLSHIMTCGDDNSGGYVTVRWRADDYVGKSLAHCHILAHVDTGMSLTFEVYDDDNDEMEQEKDAAMGMVGGHGGMRF